MAKHLRQIVEKWNTDYETPESEKGKYKGWTLEQLRAARHKPGTDKKELNFAIRAKTGWGKVSEGSLDVKVKTPEKIAQKHGVTVDKIEQQLKQGVEVEKEHTTNNEVATKIALAHLGEKPDYYTRLKKVEEVEQLDEAKWKKTKKKLGRADIKTSAQLKKEKAERMRGIKRAGKEVKDTGEKVKFQKFGNWAHKRAAAMRKIREE